MSNRLSYQTNPYLLQHAENPVDWYPWDTEAFEDAKKQDKPIFLSIGYSTCHWCHVMAHESFEDKEIADILNQHFICIKVDREERPDIDSIYMSVCQAFTGNGGWPTSIFMTAEQKPFYAGTYFPKTSQYGNIGFKQLLQIIIEKWDNDRFELLRSAEDIVVSFKKEQFTQSDINYTLPEKAFNIFRHSFDKQYGGFGNAPKFPSPQNLLFLMQYYKQHNNNDALDMAEKTLMQMYKGGLFDHIGYGFSRYSTDRYYLVPHFEKMLYDNAMLIIAYSKAFEVTKKPIYKEIAEKTAFYVLSEMKSEEGAFYSAQDADSDAQEGKYYLFTAKEVLDLLGKDTGTEFNLYYNITDSGNFAGKNIPNLIGSDDLTTRFESFMPKVREYRKKRTRLHTDDKILTAWNSLMIAALCSLYRISRNDDYLSAAKNALYYIKSNLSDGKTLHVSFRNGKKGAKGFLDDYASYIFALLAMYGVCFDNELLNEAEILSDKVINDFFDTDNGGFYLSGKDNQKLILRPKESYDGAFPSGNSIMSYNLVRLKYILQKGKFDEVTEKQLRFMSSEAGKYPAGYCMFLTALSDYQASPTTVTVVTEEDDISDLAFIVPSSAVIRVINSATSEYKLLNGQTTFYVCKNHSCLPPVNKNDFLNNEL